MKKDKILILFVSIFIVQNVFGQIEPIITDRPDQTESAAIVPKGYLQGEHGFSVHVTKPVNEYSVASTLFRYGINTNFELRLEIDPQIIVDEVENISGVNPVALGLKTKLMENNIIDLSLITHIQFAELSSPEFKTDYNAVTARLAAAHDLTGFWGIGYNIGIEWDGFHPAPYYVYTFTSGFSIGEKFGAFAEVFGEINYTAEVFGMPENTFNVHYYDGGFTFQPNENTQFDISAGLNHRLGITDYYTAVGFSYRFNTWSNKPE
ncbi:MAG: transporter [Chitinophagales bacterium]|nr:transporter [Chitinophagales bacterium]